MPARELMEWIAFEQVWGPLTVQERVDIGCAQVSFYLASLLGKSRRGRFRLRDFLPGWMRPPPVTDDADASILRATLEAWASDEGGR